MILPPIPIRDYTYDLPERQIALHPLPQRDASKLLVYKKGVVYHKIFSQLPTELDAHSTLFFNDTRVIPARMTFVKDTGAEIEVFLLSPVSPTSIVGPALSVTAPCTWQCAVGNVKRWNDGLVLKKALGKIDLSVRLVDRDRGLVEFNWAPHNKSFAEILHEAGAVPLPPYINRAAEPSDTNRYQTVYSHFEGAVAAPTAGLHFTDQVLTELRSKGILTDFLTLHVSAGTFMPVKSENALDHNMHKEQVVIKRSNIENLLKADKKVIAVGTTAMRTLESLYWYGAMLLTNPDAQFAVKSMQPYEVGHHVEPREALEAILTSMTQKGISELTGETAIFIVPGYQFKVCQGLITNFHQPGSTLLLLIAAFIGSDWKRIYAEALSKDYRFLSYGDSSLLLPF